MRKNDIEEKITVITARDRRYSREAYEFVGALVNYLAEKSGDKGKHITAGQLLAGAREYAFMQYGPFAEAVLGGWGVKSSADVGAVVFNMVEENLLRAGDGDSPEDFSVDFDLFLLGREAVKPSQSGKTIKVPTIV